MAKLNQSVKFPICTDTMEGLSPKLSYSERTDDYKKTVNKLYTMCYIITIVIWLVAMQDFNMTDVKKCMKKLTKQYVYFKYSSITKFHLD